MSIRHFCSASLSLPSLPNLPVRWLVGLEVEAAAGVSEEFDLLPEERLFLPFFEDWPLELFCPEEDEEALLLLGLDWLDKLVS